MRTGTHAQAGGSGSVAAETGKARLRRIGVIDVGSNSVRLVVFDGMARSPAYFYNEKVLCGLGAGLGSTGRLSPKGWRCALAALHRYAALAGRMQLSGMIAVATAAVREARDGPDFCAQVERETGLQLHVASGSEEAQLSAKGVLLGWPAAEGLVCDMGGSSMELAHVSGGQVHDRATAPLGPLKLAEIADGEKRARFVRKQVKALRRAVAGEPRRLFLVGGSWRAIARLDMERRGYPLKVLHGYEPPAAQLLETLAWIRAREPAELSALTGTSMARLSLVPLATLALEELIARIEPGRIAVSAYGLREGLLYRQMPEAVRRLDPLIEACRHMEAAASRMPGFGETLFDWLGPLYAGRSAAELRLVHAACLLHDANWRAHPDYRAELCFDSVTRGNVGGIDHPDRVFLGLALLNRYKATAPDATATLFRGILPEPRAAEAVILGRAMRLGAMLSGSATGVLEHARLEPGDGRLTLTLCGPAREFAGEVVERRLQSLASRLDATGVMICAE
ncbi:MAG TPA: Ppx/GppA family phosphatase [Amaricoccus sp.]|uniref:Ppx/GppA family phosphatase n=1 Tax=Amaricoccus sp. TaxID=1872485 RepID=UPI002B5210C7|nr:Ppx/GppA family phosphatase [Amaricoccus sp.]HMQ92712.1 Ppx/GppA family phosphatase [Amaricoccus sp.]HMR52545.1 Ppx/GppA family phosphatase [Amaricoccus sp.]HMR61539.1 Ppx/GppA family phosphatase [Amaricoccus sp.]HMT99466.1 Ppx/GppA family phosphatase [Amaricoccus sp.]